VWAWTRVRGPKRELSGSKIRNRGIFHTVTSAQAVRAHAELPLEVAAEMARVVPADRRHDFFDAEERRLNQFVGVAEPQRAREVRGRGAGLFTEEPRQLRWRQVDRVCQLFDRERRGEVLVDQSDDVADADVVAAIHACPNYNERADSACPVRHGRTRGLCSENLASDLFIETGP